MKLGQYLNECGVTVTDFARLIGAGSRNTVYRYMRAGQPNGQVPNVHMMRRIFAATQGAVTPNDFYDLPALGTPVDKAKAA